MKTNHALSEYISLLGDNGLILPSSPSVPESIINTPIECLSCDNRQVSGAAIFVCKGARFKTEYLSDAIRRGAVVYVSETQYDEDCPCLLVSDIRRAMALLSILFFGDAGSRLTTVGITGTKGKSTTAYYMKSILDGYLDKESAILSSIDNYDGVIREESHLTTPEPIDLHRHFFNAVESGISHLVMEVSSQALKYDRVYGTVFNAVCFNNIGTDHISPIEHTDFDDYLESKMKIFDLCEVACVNSSSDYYDRIIERARNSGCGLLTFGFNKSDDIYCYGVEKRTDGIYFTVRTPDYTKEFSITMPGMFNVENALSAIAACCAIGIPEQYVAEGLRVARAAGRMEVFDSEDGRINVIVDYAHNRMSFDALYNSVAAEYPGKKIITVFGCPGGKAFLRRRDLGESAGEHSDYIILTEEDSGEEPFDNIAADIASFVRETGCEYSIVENRGEAIREAIEEHGDDKVILITGKGRETRQKRGTLYIDTPSDVQYAEEFLTEYDAAVKASLL